MGGEEVATAATSSEAAHAAPAASTSSPSIISADASAGKQPTYLELITTKTPSAGGKAEAAPAATTAEPGKEKAAKTKRERADENWKLLDGIISESEQFDKGSNERSKVLEKLHAVLRQISKRPRANGMGASSKKYEFASAAEEWDDFLAPSCEVCNQYLDGGCKCEELEEHAASFLAPGDDVMEDAAGEELMSSSSASAAPVEAQ